MLRLRFTEHRKFAPQLGDGPLASRREGRFVRSFLQLAVKVPWPRGTSREPHTSGTKRFKGMRSQCFPSKLCFCKLASSHISMFFKCGLPCVLQRVCLHEGTSLVDRRRQCCKHGLPELPCKVLACLTMVCLLNLVLDTKD